MNYRSTLGNVRLVVHDQGWASVYQDERERLTARLGGQVRNIAHFGSTAVRGLCAKPIIDIMASLDTLRDVDRLLPLLRELGYEQTDVGFSKRRFLRRPAGNGTPAFHLHLVEESAWANKNELLLCEWLKERPEVAARYGALKEALARRYPDDMRAYTTAKSAFLRSAVNDARRSSALPPETDWTE